MNNSIELSTKVYVNTNDKVKSVFATIAFSLICLVGMISYGIAWLAYTIGRLLGRLMDRLATRIEDYRFFNMYDRYEEMINENMLK